MNLELNQLNDRLARLENENRRLKQWGGLAAGGMLALGLFGFAAPAICDIVTGERLVLHDEMGRTRVTLDAYHTETPSLSLCDASGRARAKLGLNEKGDVTLSFQDEKGGAKASYLFAANGTPKDEAPRTGDKPPKSDASVAQGD